MSQLLNAAPMESLSLNMGEISLKSKPDSERSLLVKKNIVIPAICKQEACRESASFLLYDGKEIAIKPGTYYFRSMIDGIDIGVKFLENSMDSLQHGKGGGVEISLHQRHGPYASGLFSTELLKYEMRSSTARKGASSVSVAISGSLKTGSCVIAEGEHLKFNAEATYKDLRNMKYIKKLIDSKKIVFECTNVSVVDLRFTSANAKESNANILFDKSTGVGLALSYKGNGVSGDVLWNGVPVTIPIQNDRLSLELSLHWNVEHESIKPGDFNFTGVYYAEYH
ncbi:hypothetical protein [Enterobacter hormaechei]|uniref:hypothetical protein n=2 Tax=Enterobacter TaxID=547 RepID=UPI00207439D1|nr:hypothetical protein [Enterobacter hormaechei]